jgi:hypothetical protein
MLAGAAVVLAAAGCDLDLVALSFDGSSGLVVVVISDDGSRRYRVRARQEGHADRTVDVVPGRELRLPVTGTEPVELTLLLPDGCRATTPNPQVVAPAGAAHVHATFSAECR